MSQPHEQFIETERTRLTALKTDLTTKIEDLTDQLRAADRAIHALSVYEQALSGKAPPSTASQPRRGTKREAVLTIIKNNPGITRSVLIERMGVKGQKSQEGSLSNLLATLKKAGTLTLEGGKYSIA